MSERLQLAVQNEHLIAESHLQNFSKVYTLVCGDENKGPIRESIQ